MNEKEITALAREYAEEIYPHEECEDLGQMEFLRNNAIKHISSTLKMLLRRYCLVEKKAVAECYSYAVNHLNEMKDLGSTVEDRIYNEGELNGKIALLESFFPDLTWDDEPQEVEIIIKRKKKNL